MGALIMFRENRAMPDVRPAIKIKFQIAFSRMSAMSAMSGSGESTMDKTPYFNCFETQYRVVGRSVGVSHVSWHDTIEEAIKKASTFEEGHIYAPDGACLGTYHAVTPRTTLG